MGTVADWDTRKSEIIWGQKAACRALPGAFATLRGCQGCPLTSEVTWGQKAKDPRPQVLRRGRSGPPLTENSVLSAPGPSLAAFCLLEGFKAPLLTGTAWDICDFAEGVP